MRSMYSYVGPKRIADRVPHQPAGIRVESAEDVLRWVRQTGQELDSNRSVTATFIIDETGWLHIADRRSEHVACSSGRRVRSAGEITFTVKASDVIISWVTNQSTGFCPEPDSWPAVENALTRAGIGAPDGFIQAFDFRRCPRCGVINIIKDRVFECGVCFTSLPEEWNFDAKKAMVAGIELSPKSGEQIGEISSSRKMP